MELVYLSHRRRRRLWPVTGAIVLVGSMVTLQAMVLTMQAERRPPQAQARVLPMPVRHTGLTAKDAAADVRSARSMFADGIVGGD